MQASHHSGGPPPPFPFRDSQRKVGQAKQAALHCPAGGLPVVLETAAEFLALVFFPLSAYYYVHNSRICTCFLCCTRHTSTLSSSPLRTTRTAAWISAAGVMGRMRSRVLLGLVTGSGCEWRALSVTILFSTTTPPGVWCFDFCTVR